MSDIANDLKVIIRGEVATDQTALERYSRDWSLFKVMPRAVVFPYDTRDVRALVGYATRTGISLTARAAGTDMSGGPLNEGIIMDFTRHMNALKEVGNDDATAEPGMYYRDFEREVGKYGLLFPSYPASKALCAIGGIVANNSGGEKSLTYGKTARYVKRINMVCADGIERTFHPMNPRDITDDASRKLYELCVTHYPTIQKERPKVSKNSTGYALWDAWNPRTDIFDPTQVIVGSQGTLGIITEVTLGLIRPKEHSALLVLMVDGAHFAKLGEIVNAILVHKPESFESYDDHTLHVALKNIPGLIKYMGAGGLFTLGLQFLPELWMALTGGIPKLVLVAEFTGDSEDEIYAKAGRARDDLKRFDIKMRIAKNDHEEAKYWAIRRQSFKLLTDHSRGMRTLPFIDDIVVRPEYLPEFLPQLNTIMDAYDLVYTIQGHMGDGNFHIIPLDKIGDKKLLTIVPELSEKVFDLVTKYHGSLSGEHNDGIVRTPYLGKMYSPEMLALFREVKKIFDPHNIFNPGKKVGDTVNYEVAHIDLDPARHW